MKKILVFSAVVLLVFSYCAKNNTTAANQTDFSNPVKGYWRGPCELKLGGGEVVERTFYFHFLEDHSYWLSIDATYHDEPAPDYELEEEGTYVVQQNTIKLIPDGGTVRMGNFSVGPWNLSLDFFDFGEMVLRRYLPSSN